MGLTELLTMFSLRKRERWLREKTILSKRVSPFDFVFYVLCLCVWSLLVCVGVLLVLSFYECVGGREYY